MKYQIDWNEKPRVRRVQRSHAFGMSNIFEICALSKLIKKKKKHRACVFNCELWVNSCVIELVSFLRKEKKIVLNKLNRERERVLLSISGENPWKKKNVWWFERTWTPILWTTYSFTPCETPTRLSFFFFFLLFESFRMYVSANLSPI